MVSVGGGKSTQLPDKVIFSCPKFDTVHTAYSKLKLLSLEHLMNKLFLYVEHIVGKDY